MAHFHKTQIKILQGYIDNSLLRILTHMVIEHNYEPNKIDLYKCIDTKLIIGCTYNITIETVFDSYKKLCPAAYKESNTDVFQSLIDDFLTIYPKEGENDVFFSPIG